MSMSETWRQRYARLRGDQEPPVWAEVRRGRPCTLAEQGESVELLRRHCPTEVVMWVEQDVGGEAACGA